LPEFLRAPFADGPALAPLDVLIRLIVAAILGTLVAWTYRATRHPTEVARTFPVTLVLLSVLIAMVTQVIGNNVARAFSLVGALSIVRFRTVVRDTEDTAFVIFAVVIGMAVGARDLVVAGIGLLVTGGVAFLVRPRESRLGTGGAPFVLHLRVGIGHDIEAIVGGTLDAHMGTRQLMSMSTAKQGLAVDVSFVGPLKPGMDAQTLVKALNRIDGVQTVELARQAPAQD